MPTNNPLQHMPQPGQLPGSRPSLTDAISPNKGCNRTHSTALPVGHSCCTFNSSSACSIGNKSQVPHDPQRECRRCLRCAHLGLVTMLSWLLHSASSWLMVAAVSFGNFRAIIGHCTETPIHRRHNQTHSQ